MNCNTAQRLLSAYVDAELTNHEMDRVRRHLSSCDGCRIEEDDLRRLKSILTCTPLVEPPVGFEERLCSAVFATHASAASRPIGETWPLMSGIALVTAAITLFVVNYIGTVEPEDVRSSRAMAWSMQRDDASLVGADPYMSTSTAIPTSYVGK